MPALDDFRRAYPLRLPDPSRVTHHDQVILLTLGQGLRYLEHAPAKEFLEGNPRTSTIEPKNTYLWVFDDHGVPYILEMTPGAAMLHDKVAKHTNLTGGRGAYCGGELWFHDEKSLWISGGSGRYGPLSEEELSLAVTVFQEFGYHVNNLGWDSEAHSPRRNWKNG
jgi:hypothetical protein